MQLNKLNNIVFLKDVESNLIEEAFVVLKDNVNLTKLEEKINKAEAKKSVLNEVEVLINTELKVNELKFEEYKFKKLNKKYNFLKIINIILVVVSVFIFFR